MNPEQKKWRNVSYVRFPESKKGRRGYGDAWKRMKGRTTTILHLLSHPVVVYAYCMYCADIWVGRKKRERQTMQ